MAEPRQDPQPPAPGPARFEEAIRRFSLANASDPTSIDDGGHRRPRELVQAERLAKWVDRLEPTASEALRLAAHCQHLERWKIPRGTFPEGRTGYLMWRKELGRFHADRSSEILRSVGYDEETIERVRTINQKKSLKAEPDVQTMEDALCLAFLEYEMEEFSVKHADDKVVDILVKTWRKMSERGHTEALRLPFSERVGALVEKALSGART
jgi:Domain of unknown function (DUF4202)